MRHSSLLGKLLGAILLPTVITFAGFGLLCHHEARRALEAELSRGLGAIAAAAAAQISEESLALLTPGDEKSRTYRNLRRRLAEMRDVTGAARLYVFDRELRSLVDTSEVPIGARYYELYASRTELKQVFAEPGRPASSLLFRGRDGRLYKSGYAPVRGPAEHAPRFAVGVDGSALFYEELSALRRTLLFVGGAGILVMVILGVLLGRRITRPLLQLASSARTIEKGVLERPVSAPLLVGHDEVAVLSRSLESMRQGLRARDERLQMMLSGIAHEVRNPLGGMELFSGLLREELSVEGERMEGARSYLARIEREIGYLKAVVGDFLDYARRPQPVLQPVPVPPLLREVADSARAMAKRARVAVVAPEGESGGSGPRCRGDLHQLRRALLNLSRNAVEACERAEGRDPEVTIGWRLPQDPPGGVQIFVCDNGPGIPDEALPRIFVPFFTTREKGTGLGLAFVREIVEDHEGKVQVETGAHGTTFTLTLPLWEGGPSHGMEEERGPAHGQHPDHR